MKVNVTLDQLRRYTFEKQGLLTRQPMSEVASFGPLHATDHTTPYLSVLARTEMQQWEQFGDLYYDHHAFKRLRCMRGTLHLIPEAQVETVQCAYRFSDQDEFPEFTEYNINLDAAFELRFEIMDILLREGSQTSASIKHYLPEKWGQKYKNKYGGETTAIGPVMRWLWSLGLIESGIGVNNWRHKDNHFRITDVAPVPCHDATQNDLGLARWYFSLYGPAAHEDWQWWSGFTAGRSLEVFNSLREELVEIEVQGIKETLWMLTVDANVLQQTPDEKPEMIRLLPYEDALLKAYKATRYRFYDPDEIAEGVAFSQHGEALPTMWCDGHIIGLWSWSKKAKEPMTVEPYIQMTKPLRKRFKSEVDKVKAFVEASHVLWTS